MDSDLLRLYHQALRVAEARNADLERRLASETETRQHSQRRIATLERQLVDLRLHRGADSPATPRQPSNQSQISAVSAPNAANAATEPDRPRSARDARASEPEDGNSLSPSDAAPIASTSRSQAVQKAAPGPPGLDHNPVFAAFAAGPSRAKRRLSDDVMALERAQRRAVEEARGQATPWTTARGVTTLTFPDGTRVVVPQDSS